MSNVLLPKFEKHRMYCANKGCKKFIIYKIESDDYSGQNYYAQSKYGSFDIRNQCWYCNKHEGIRK